MILISAEILSGRENDHPWRYAVLPPEIIRKCSLTRGLCEFVFMRFDEDGEHATWTFADGAAWGLTDERVILATFDAGSLDSDRRLSCIFVFSVTPKVEMRLACVDAI
jgi:hypothetical protein